MQIFTSDKITMYCVSFIWGYAILLKLIPDKSGMLKKPVPHFGMLKITAPVKIKNRLGYMTCTILLMVR